jgi:hypothetical protein
VRASPKLTLNLFVAGSAFGPFDSQLDEVRPSPAQAHKLTKMKVKSVGSITPRRDRKKLIRWKYCRKVAVFRRPRPKPKTLLCLHHNETNNKMTNKINEDERGRFRLLKILDPNGQATVVMVEGSPLVRYKDNPPELLLETRKQISKMVERDQPANVLWLVSDVIKDEAEREDTQQCYKAVYGWLHQQLEGLLEAFVSNKLIALAEAIQSGEAVTEPFKA